MITEIDARRFGKLTARFHKLTPCSSPAPLDGRYWMTLDRQRLGVIELQDAVQWRATVFDRDTRGLYVPEHYKDIWGSESEAVERLVEMLLAEPDRPADALCVSRNWSGAGNKRDEIYEQQ
jgi:hypothetical protein